MASIYQLFKRSEQVTDLTRRILFCVILLMAILEYNVLLTIFYWYWLWSKLLILSKFAWHNRVQPRLHKEEQVAQLWQRDRAKLDSFLINVQRYSQNHKITFLGHPIRASGAIQAPYMKVLMQKNSQQSFIEKMPVLLWKQRLSVSESSFVGISYGVTYAIYL